MKHGPGARRLKPQRRARRERQRTIDREKEEQNRRRAIGGGQPDELGVMQGQSGEQGNSSRPDDTESIGRSAR